MYAIIEVGGKQYKAESGAILEIERQEAKKGKDISLDKVLLISADSGVSVGRPYIKGARVSAELIRDFKGRKVISYKYRRRKSSDWKKGHRQQLTRIRIKEVLPG